jgi:hypothetical protein
MREPIPLHRVLIVGILVAMMVRWTDWLMNPSAHPDATTGRYALVLASIAICGFTAWATWRADERLTRKLQEIVTSARRVVGRS